MNKETTTHLSKDGWDKLTEVLHSVKTPTPEMIELYHENSIELTKEDSLAFIESLNVSKEANPKFMEAAANYKKNVMNAE